MNRSEFLAGFKASFPIVLGYIPIGFAFGVLAMQSGLTLFEIFLMSALVYAGSAQFIAVGMLAIGASVSSIIFTTFLVNLRHLLMSASMAPHLKDVSRKILPILSYGLTDETFAVGITEVVKKRRRTSYFLGLHATSHLAWITSTVAGGLFGNLIVDSSRYGLNFALPAMFIGLLLMQVKSKTSITVAAIAGILSIFISFSMKGNWNIIIATIIAATLGVVIEQWTQKFSSSLSE